MHLSFSITCARFSIDDLFPYHISNSFKLVRVIRCFMSVRNNKSTEWNVETVCWSFTHNHDFDLTKILLIEWKSHDWKLLYFCTTSSKHVDAIPLSKFHTTRELWLVEFMQFSCNHFIIQSKKNFCECHFFSEWNSSFLVFSRRAIEMIEPKKKNSCSI